MFGEPFGWEIPRASQPRQCGNRPDGRLRWAERARVGGVALPPTGAARPEHLPDRQRAARARILATAGRLPDRRHARPRRGTSSAAGTTITYHNRSPDALPYLWLHLEQNMCAPGSLTTQLDQPPLVFLGSTFDFSCKGFPGGLTLDSVLVGGVPSTPVVYGTAMRLDLRAPLAPAARWSCAWSGTSTCRPSAAGAWATTGRSTRSRSGTRALAVYDDVRGWNHEPYIGGGRVLPRVRRASTSSLTVPAQLRRGRHRHAAEPRAGAHRGPAGAPRRAPRHRTTRSPSSPRERPAPHAGGPVASQGP